MKKNILSFILIFAVVIQLSGQTVETPKFTATASKTEVKCGDILDLVIEADIPDNWHLYSTQTDCSENNGPLYAEITITSSPNFELVGSIASVGDSMHLDEIFECSTGEFSKKAVFVQKVKIKKSVEAIELEFYGQMCKQDGTGMCVLVKDKFKSKSITVK